MSLTKQLPEANAGTKPTGDRVQLKKKRGAVERLPATTYLPLGEGGAKREFADDKPGPRPSK